MDILVLTFNRLCIIIQYALTKIFESIWILCQYTGEDFNYEKSRRMLNYGCGR